MIARILQRPVAWICTGAILFLLIGVTVRSCAVARQALSKARLSTEMAKAGMGNAKDAVGAVGAVSERATDTETLTRENEHAIRTATGANNPVDDGVHTAGLNSLCRRPAYRCSIKCVQRASARGMANAGSGCTTARRPDGF